MRSAMYFKKWALLIALGALNQVQARDFVRQNVNFTCDVLGSYQDLFTDEYFLSNKLTLKVESHRVFVKSKPNETVLNNSLAAIFDSMDNEVMPLPKFSVGFIANKGAENSDYDVNFAFTSLTSKELGILFNAMGDSINPKWSDAENVFWGKACFHRHHVRFMKRGADNMTCRNVADGRAGHCITNNYIRIKQIHFPIKNYSGASYHIWLSCRGLSVKRSN